MKRVTNFSNFDVFTITRELDKTISDGTIVNVYEIDDLLILKINTKSLGKKNLIIENDSRINLTNYDYPVPKYPSQFIISLRKLLKSKKIFRVSQHNFDRILILELDFFEGKNWKFIIELFNKGNYIILDENNLVKVAKSYNRFRERDVLPNREYSFPALKGENFLTINKEDFKKIIENSNNELVRILARNISISGLYSEEICFRAEIDKKKKGEQLKNIELDKLFEEFKNLRNQLLFGDIKAHILLDTEGNEINVIPFELNLFKNYNKKYYTSFNEAVDEYYSKIDSARILKPSDQNLIQRINAQEKILNNQLEYLEELKKKKKKYYEFGDFIYANFNDLQRLFDIIKNAKDKGYNWEEINIKLLSAKEDNLEILKFFKRVLPATQQLVLNINNEEVYLDLNESIGENANSLYTKGKKADKKVKGTIPAIENTKEKIKKLQLEKNAIENDIEFLIKKPKKKWYEKFHWFRSSDGFLVIGGRDATTNELIYKKYLENDDLVFHTNFPSSPLAIVKNPGGKKIPETTIKETADFVASYSKAWRESWTVVDVFFVFPDQVSKSPPSGEFLPKGSFMITGKKNLIKNAQTKLAIGIKIRKLDPNAKNFYPQIICGPIEAVESQISDYLILKPAKKGLSKGKLVKEIKSYYIKKSKDEFKKWFKIISEDEIALYLPSGSAELHN
ncbi:MAG: ribosome rescue protein RqcH [Candidatus Hodarchaeota archaeon]